MAMDYVAGEPMPLERADRRCILRSHEMAENPRW